MIRAEVDTPGELIIRYKFKDAMEQTASLMRKINENRQVDNVS